MLNFSITELILILVIALVVFGPGKLPEVGKALGRGIEEFRSATSGAITKEDNKKLEAKTEEKDPSKS